MIRNNIKIALFGALIVAMVLPFSGMTNVSAEETGKAIQIQKPMDSQIQKDTKTRALALVDERNTLESQGNDLKEKYQTRGEQSLTSSDITQLDTIEKRLSEITVEFENINIESRKLDTTTPQEKQILYAQKQILRDSDIPYFGLGTDMRVGALTISFTSEEQANEFIPKINKILSVPYYVDIGPADVDLSCTNINSNCDPLMGGIEIETEKGTNDWTTCSISVPIYRNVWWWTEEGFVTAAHCFENNLNNDARQPTGSSNKVGDVTKTQNSGECDCAFVKLSSSEDTLFGNWIATSTSNQLLSKSDAQLFDYVLMIGKTSEVQLGQVTDVAYDSGIQDMHKVNNDMDHGDSGGSVIDNTTKNVYHGIIKGGNLSTYTSYVPWSHVDAALDLQ